MTLLLGSLILAMSCIGNAELWVIFVNRRHAWKYKHHTLKRIRKLHDWGMILFPPFLLIVAGLRSNGLLRGGTFFDLQRSVQGLICLTSVGFVLFVASVLRWQFRRNPKRLLSVSSTTKDFLAEATSDEERQRITGDSPPVLTRFPWNEIYTLEINEKRLSFDGNANQRKQLSIAHFSDTHFIGCPGVGYHSKVIDELLNLRPDCFVFTGDLLDRANLLDAAVEQFSRLADAAPCYFILGNHDWHLDHERIRKQLTDAGCVNVGERHELTTIGDVKLRIAGTEDPWLGDNPQVPGRTDEDLRLLLSHSADQRDFALKNDFDLMLCGHTHGGQVVLPVVGPVYSPSIYGVRYAGGVFEHHGMMMHVSRGIAGKDPLRWNCRPEITRLTLQFGPGG